MLALKHKQIPPSLHFEEPNPEIDFENSPFFVNTELREWQRNGTPLRAGVSSFGVSGTNAHVIVEEAPEVELRVAEHVRSHHLLSLSAKSEVALTAMVQRYLEYSQTHEEVSLNDIAYTSQLGRAHFEHRLSVVADSHTQLQQRLHDFIQTGIGNGIQQGHSNDTATNHAPVFLFTGQGAQYANMGQQLYNSAPIFTHVIDECAQYLASELDHDVRSILWGEHTALLDQTQYTQPALFVLEYALARLWQSWGIQPTAVMGHSVGEYVAACIAEVFSLADALKLITSRARLMQALPEGGGMLAVQCDEDTLTQYLAEYNELVIAAYNGAQSLVVSGALAQLERLSQQLEQEDIKVKPLAVSHAFHSSLMQPMLEAFTEVAESITYSPPTLELISNVTGQVIHEEIATPEYWVEHIRTPVRFAQGMQTLDEKGYTLYIELGPQPVLLGMGRACLDNGETSERQWIPSLRANREDWEQLLDSVGYLYISNAPIDWKAFYQPYAPNKTTLPTYPFQRQRYWIDANFETESLDLTQLPGATGHPLLGRKINSVSLRTGEVLFESLLRVDSTAYLKDHKVHEHVVFPGTGYIEMALAAGQKLFQTKKIAIENITFQKPLIFDSHNYQKVQLFLKPLKESYSFEIFSTLSDSKSEHEWVKACFWNITSFINRTRIF